MGSSLGIYSGERQRGSSERIAAVLVDGWIYQRLDHYYAKQLRGSTAGTTPSIILDQANDSADTGPACISATLP